MPVGGANFLCPFYIPLPPSKGEMGEEGE